MTNTCTADIASEIAAMISKPVQNWLRPMAPFAENNKLPMSLTPLSGVVYA